MPYQNTPTQSRDSVGFSKTTLKTTNICNTLTKKRSAM